MFSRPNKRLIGAEKECKSNIPCHVVMGKNWPGLVLGSVDFIQPESTMTNLY